MLKPLVYRSTYMVWTNVCQHRKSLLCKGVLPVQNPCRRCHHFGLACKPAQALPSWNYVEVLCSSASCRTLHPLPPPGKLVCDASCNIPAGPLPNFQLNFSMGGFFFLQGKQNTLQNLTLLNSEVKEASLRYCRIV